MSWILLPLLFLVMLLLSGGRPIAFAASLLPLPIALFFGERLGDLLRALGVRKKVARQNLRQAFPEKSEAEREAILRDFYRHLGTLILEFLRAPYLSERRVKELVEVDWEAYRRFEEKRAEGKGAIVATAHFGNFELLGSFFSRHGLPLTAITKALPRNFLNRFWLDQRKRAGLRELPDSGSLREILKVLRRSETLAVMIDQNMIPRRAVFAPFFGKLAATTPAPAVFAERAEAPVYLVLLHRLPGGRHRVRIEGPIPFERTGDPAADRLAFTARLNRALEEQIREAPHLWYWIHRRWKTRPPGESAAEGEGALAPTGGS